MRKGSVSDRKLNRPVSDLRRFSLLSHRSAKLQVRAVDLCPMTKPYQLGIIAKSR